MTVRERLDGEVLQDLVVNAGDSEKLKKN